MVTDLTGPDGAHSRFHSWTPAMQSLNADEMYLLETGLITGRHADEVKRAHRAADQLQRDLLSGASTENFSLGTIPEIRERYGLGLWACREAIGILELRGVARLRSGRGGGLVPLSPTLGDLAKLVLLHLYMKRASTNELIEARRLVHLAVLRHLVDRGGRPSEVEQLASVSTDRGRPSFSGWLAAQTGNEAFSFFVGFVEALCEGYANYCGEDLPGLGPDVRQKEEAVWKAVCRKEPEAARLALLDYLTATQPVVADKPIRVRRLLDDRNSKGSAKFARRVAMHLVEEVVERSSGATDLGSELDIGMRHDANSAIVRQAIRLLEDLGLVRSRRGRNGGIEVRKPDLMSIIGMIPHILMQQGLSLSECFHARGMLTLEICKAAAAAARDGAGTATEPLLPKLGRTQDLIDLDRSIVELLGNSVLTACAQGFMMYAWSVEPPSAAEEVPSALVSRLFDMTRTIEDRILEGDVEGAEAAALEKHQLLALRFTSPKASHSKARHPLNVLNLCMQELGEGTLPA